MFVEKIAASSLHKEHTTLGFFKWAESDIKNSL